VASQISDIMVSLIWSGGSPGRGYRGTASDAEVIANDRRGQAGLPSGRGGAVISDWSYGTHTPDVTDHFPGSPAPTGT